MEKYFNTAGPNQPDSQYTLNPLKRIDLAEIELLFEQKKYFVLHAPRQTGKTSCMLALRDYLNREGDYIAVYANVEGGQDMILFLFFLITGLLLLEGSPPPRREDDLAVRLKDKGKACYASRYGGGRKQAIRVESRDESLGNEVEELLLLRRQVIGMLPRRYDGMVVGDL